MTFGKKPTDTKETKEAKKYDDSFETVAIIKTMNVYDPIKKEYTTEMNSKSVKVETFVKDLKTEKPEVIGYINIATLEKFLDGNVKAVPIKIKKGN